MLTNKHLVIALLVAPILSILAWFAVGNLIGEQPGAAVPGRVYPLLEKSNCRYGSGACELVNGDVSLSLKLLAGKASPTLQLESSVSLQAVAVAVVSAQEIASDEPIPPRSMHSVDGNTSVWQLPLPARFAQGDRLRLVAATAQNRFTAELSTRFSQEKD